MARNIQIREPGNNYADVLHPETNSGMVLMANGKTLQNDLDTHKADYATHKAECAILIPKAGSTANAILLDIVLTDKKKGSFRAVANNTGNMTINGKPFKKDASTQIPAGGVKANRVYDFYYDGTANCVFILAKASGNAQPSDVLAGKTFSNDDGEQTGTKDLSNLVPENIKKGIKIDNVTGNFGIVESLMEVGEIIIAQNGSSMESPSTTPRSILTSRYLPTVQKSGFYRISFAFNANSSETQASAQIYKNGAPYGKLRVVLGITVMTFTEDLYFNAGDKIDLYVWVDRADRKATVPSKTFQIKGISGKPIITNETDELIF